MVLEGSVHGTVAHRSVVRQKQHSGGFSRMKLLVTVRKQKGKEKAKEKGMKDKMYSLKASFSDRFF